MVVFAPGPYDGYITPVEGGFELAAAGVVLDVVADRDIAETRLAEHCASRPRWFVHEDGRKELLAPGAVG